ncbi:hypothetical protein PR202_gb21682 [Eleusine coracana subsp. coracana]|uniref:J domain-containing protein n=1 Tax=Eleusine coracana subsp. coracana TaxID=191504 RepID=A0AAV5FDS7_ELECO|nr:hypothetical protein QOZ80_7BG0608890 [Eleusine coracana subsp. coracana]GJN33116.1 hypothetical protein PR202_gb21682 [Eleusine coracana subsp. coracana]
MDFSAGGGRGRSEPARWLEIAGRLLAARDLIGCKRLAERVVEADPHLPGTDELLAVADVLLASQRHLPSGRPDPFAVLQLQPDADHAAVMQSFTRLSRLLSSPPNPYTAAPTALQLVQQAFADLPDNLKNAPADPPSEDAAAAADAFWTACPYCCNVYQYQRELVGRALRCQSTGCRRAFVATELPTVPPIVPGTDMYYCAWGFVPMGFPKAADLSTNWKPFCPMFSGNQSAPQPASAGTSNVDVQRVENNGGPIPANATPENAQPAKKSVVSGGVHTNATPESAQPAKKGGVSGGGVEPPRRMKKTTARKKVGAVLKKHVSGGVESGIEPSMVGSGSVNGNAGSGHAAVTRGININEVAKPADSSTVLNFGGGEEIGFDLDVDATDAILGNLQHLPFLREDDNNRRMF